MKRAIPILFGLLAACSRKASPAPAPPAIVEKPHWVMNGLAELQKLSMNALSTTTLMDTASYDALFATPNDRLFFQYMVECALPEGAKLKYSGANGMLEFHGALGLAPEWAMSSCGQPCQEWVTACMFARTNYYGIPVQFSMRGANPAIMVGDDEKKFATVEEGAFFGNMFLDPQVGFACRGSGDDPITTVVRRCTFADPGMGATGAPPNCWFFQMGTPCASICDGRDPNGGYLRCNTPNDAGPQWTRPITIYLRATDLTPISDGSCK